MSVMTTIHIGTVERVAVGSVLDGTEQALDSSLMVWGMRA